MLHFPCAHKLKLIYIKIIRAPKEEAVTALGAGGKTQLETNTDVTLGLQRRLIGRGREGRGCLTFRFTPYFFKNLLVFSEASLILYTQCWPKFKKSVSLQQTIIKLAAAANVTSRLFRNLANVGFSSSCWIVFFFYLSFLTLFYFFLGKTIKIRTMLSPCSRKMITSASLALLLP